MPPIVYHKDELEDILKNSDIDGNITIRDCKVYMSRFGWSTSVNKPVNNFSGLVKHNGILKKLENFEGHIVEISRDDIRFSSVMENERDALLVCILMAIRSGK